MRKHFLILMLMALLPLSTWAAVDPNQVTIQCANIAYTYAANDIPADGTDAIPDMIGLYYNPNGFTKAQVAEALTFTRVGSTSTEVNELGYEYKLVKKAGYTGDIDVTITGGNGTLYIKRIPITINVTSKTVDYGVNPTLTFTKEGDFLTGEAPTITCHNEAASTNAGTYTKKLTASIEGEWAYEGHYNVTINPGTLTINKIVGTASKAAAALATSVDVNAIIYNRLAWKPELTVSYNNEVLTTESGAIAITYTNNINAGTATATVNFINYKNGDNSDFKKDVQFTIKKKSLGTDGVAAPGITTAFTSSFPGWTYSNTVKSTGGAATKVYYKVGDVKEALDKATDYDREAVGDFKNATANVAEADKPYYLFTGKGNYEGTVKLAVTIAQKELTITADNKDKVFGNADPELTFKYTGFATGDFTGTPGVDETPNDGVMTIAPTVTRAEGENVGTFTIKADGAVANNYKMKYVDGTFTITEKAILVQVTNVEKTYGEADPKEFGYTVSPTSLASKVSNVVLAREDGEDVKVGGYAITGTADAAAGYSVTVVPGVLTINKADLKFTAKNQTIEQGEAPVVTSGIAEDADLYTVSGFKYEDEDNLDISAATVTMSSTVTDVSPAGEYLGAAGLQITVTGLTLDNYNVVPVNGNVYVKGNGGTITLTRVAKERISEANVTELVEAYDGTTGHTVKIKFDDATGYNTMKPNKWYAMVLPFETDVKEISNAFGYAIVDLLKTTNDNVHRTIFKLKMDNQKIPANTPFIIKVWNTLDLNAEPVQFTGKTIVKPAVGTALAPNGNLVSEDAVGNKFIGSYDGIDGLGNSQAGYSGHVTWFSLKQDDDLDEIAIKASDTAYLRQMSAFNFIVDTPATHEFIIEELGGETTVIRGINAEAETFTGDTWYNLNGMKMQNVPSTKGIYINNGKKFVVK